MKKVLFQLYLLLVIVQIVFCTLRDFATCHDDFNLKPPDGILKDHTFTWLGFAQYLHVSTGLPHHSKAPRVVLIHKQFAAGTAVDMLRLPKNYQLGKIIFGDYERDEMDCGLTQTQTKMGIKCQRAYIEIPIIDISPHPEYTRFGVGNSLALVKLLSPVKSHYMIPICLPSISEREKKRRNKVVFMVDYLNSVPRDFDSERMAKKSLKLFTHKECRRHRLKSKLGSEGVTHVLCSSGCGVRPGAPLVSHAMEGPFQLIGIAAGGAPCIRRAMRKRLNREPPLYIDVYPYVSWITNFITGNVLPRPYPENFMLVDGGSRAVCWTPQTVAQKRVFCQSNVTNTRNLIFLFLLWAANKINVGLSTLDGFQQMSIVLVVRVSLLLVFVTGMGLHQDFLRTRRKQKTGWRARTFVVGDYCFDSYKKMRRTAFFYSESFEVNANPPAKMNVIIKLSAGIETTIVCAKLLMPNRFVEPVIDGVGGYNITVVFSSLWFPYSYYFSLGLHGKNTTQKDMMRWVSERKEGFW